MKQMKKTLPLGVAAAATLLLLQPAIAQSVSVDPSVGADVSVEAGVSTENGISAEAGVSAGATASGAVDTSYGSLISSLRTGAKAELTTVTEATVIHFVTVSSLSASDQAAALDNALADNEASVTSLRTEVEANAVLSARVTEAGYETEDIVAIVANADGSLTVYIDDRA
jgi:hypothetical protein